MPQSRAGPGEHVGPRVGSATPQQEDPPPHRGSPRSIRVLSLAIPLVLGLACSVWFITFTLDDPWVSFRYAWQLAHGHGLVYNPGQRVEGYSNFLWTVLMAGVIRAGGDPLAWAKAIGIALQAATIVGVWWCARRLLCERAGLTAKAVDLFSGVAAASYATLIFAGMWSVAALETPLFTAILVATLAAFVRRRFALAAMLLFLASITRPEGLLLFGTFVIIVFATEWRGGRLTVATLVRSVVPFAVPAAAFLAWRIAYYGSPLPNTYYDKTGGALVSNLDGGLAYVGSFAGALVGVHGGVPVLQFRVRMALLLLAALGVAGCALIVLALRARRRGLALALAWITVNLVYTVYVGGDWMPAFRFLVPATPFLVLAVWCGLADVYQGLAGRTSTRRLAGALLAVTAVAAAGSSYAQMQTAYAQVRWLKPVTQDNRIRPNDAYYAAARWVHAHLPAGSFVAIEEAGLLPYLNEQDSFLDLFGLTDEHLAHAPGQPPFGKEDNTYVLARAPQYAVLTIVKSRTGELTWAPHLSLLQDPRFKQQYVRIAVLRRNALGDFWIFERR